MDIDEEEEWRKAILQVSKGKSARAAGSRAEARTSRSALGEELLVEWGYGIISASMVQKFASLAAVDIRRAGGQENAMLTKLALMQRTIC